MARQRMKIRMPGSGWSPNPLLRHGRNNPCLCGSGVKFKKCCLPKMSPYLPTEIVNDMRGKSIGSQAATFVAWAQAKNAAKEIVGEEVESR